MGIQEYGFALVAEDILARHRHEDSSHTKDKFDLSRKNLPEMTFIPCPVVEIFEKQQTFFLVKK